MKRTITFSASPSHFNKNNTDTGISPSEHVIRNILNYSKALAVLKTERTGTINMVMN
jgi:hypothetical protein